MTSKSLPIVLIAATLCSACSKEPEPTPAEKVAAASVPGAPPGAADDVAAKAATASDVKESSDLIEFAYSYPREAAAIPDNTPRFLSLSSDISTYTGGAHGMTSFDTLIWDRNRAIRLKPLDLFTSGEAFDAAIRKPFCDAIVRAKAARGIAPSDDPDGIFDKCPAASTQTVWLGSSDGKYLDRLTIGIAPYEIGPYAEGNYKINVPVTGALVKVVKPEYQRDFLPLN